MEMTHAIDWSREALRMILLLGRAAVGGSARDWASGQRGADADPVARTGRGAHSCA